MIEVLNAGTGANSATRDKWPRAVLPRTFDFGFSAQLSLKDTRLALDEARAMGVPLPTGERLEALLERVARDLRRRRRLHRDGQGGRGRRRPRSGSNRLNPSKGFKLLSGIGQIPNPQGTPDDAFQEPNEGLALHTRRAGGDHEKSG